MARSSSTTSFLLVFTLWAQRDACSHLPSLLNSHEPTHADAFLLQCASEGQLVRPTMIGSTTSCSTYIWNALARKGTDEPRPSTATKPRVKARLRSPSYLKGKLLLTLLSTWKVRLATRVD